VAGFGAMAAYSYARLRTVMFPGVRSQRAGRPRRGLQYAHVASPLVLLPHWIFK
jgi:hypothetical protein